jgi:hypothetical protein
MPTTQAIAWKYSNRYSADKACEHCEGIIRHETWCITRSPIVLYAYQSVLNADSLSEGDRITLHALGVEWALNNCTGTCKSEAAATT